MRVISDFHDFYDSVQKFGQDRALIYHRTTYSYDGVLPFDKHIYYERLPLTYVTKQVQYCVIGFCGKLYPLVVFNDGKAICYSMDEVDDYFEAHYRGRDLEEYKKKYSKVWSWGLRRKSFRAFFDYYKEYTELARVRDLQEGHRAPIFIVAKSRAEPVRLTFNIKLETYAFQRIVNPYAAYQEISMFLGNIAAPERPLPEIDDLTMCEAKGFDKKSSFRKEAKAK